MKSKKFIFGIIFLMVTNLPTSIRAEQVEIAELSDYEKVILAFSTLFCYELEGYITRKDFETYRSRAKSFLLKEHGISSERLYNILDTIETEDALVKYVEGKGGCKAIIQQSR